MIIYYTLLYNNDIEPNWQLVSCVAWNENYDNDCV